MIYRLAFIFGLLIVLGCQSGSSPPGSLPGSDQGGTPSTPPSGQGTRPVTAQPAVGLTAPTTPVPVGQEVRMALEAQKAQNLYAVALTVKYDPAQLSYRSYVEGDLLNRDGASTEVEVGPSEEVPGELLVGLTRVGGVGGISGSGVLLTLVFQATQSGPAQVQIDDATATLRDADDTPLSVTNWKGVVLTIQ